MPPQSNKNGDGSDELKRTYSESDMSEVDNESKKDYRDYRVRKSSLIG